VVEGIPDAPTPMAVRRMMHILEEKGFLAKRRGRGGGRGKEVVYVPREAKVKAGRTAFERVLETFFGGSLEEALATHLVGRKDRLSAEERDRLVGLIEQTRNEDG
jgi:hypothetical protein